MKELADRVSVYNGWFTSEEVKKSLKAWGNLLTEKNLEKWLSKYKIDNIDSDKVIAIIMAGNIPLVGFHDFLSVYVTGMKMKIKLSSDDNKLLPQVISILSQFDPEIKNRVEFVNDKLSGFDAVIATGSNNTSRYFEQYFGKYPNIIRKNRTSVAVIQGNESEEELKNLALDVFTYYGLGCRNVTKLYLPEGYDLDRIFGAFYAFNYVANNNKYANNYDYHKAVFLMEKYDILENGFLIMKEDKNIHSPIGTLFYEYYDSSEKLKNELDQIAENLQCIVGKEGIPFGKAQTPELWDYADNVDTVRFLLEL